MGKESIQSEGEMSQSDILEKPGSFQEDANESQSDQVVEVTLNGAGILGQPASLVGETTQPSYPTSAPSDAELSSGVADVGEAQGNQSLTGTEKEFSSQVFSESGPNVGAEGGSAGGSMSVLDGGSALEAKPETGISNAQVHEKLEVMTAETPDKEVPELVAEEAKPVVDGQDESILLVQPVTVEEASADVVVQTSEFVEVTPTRADVNVEVRETSSLTTVSPPVPDLDVPTPAEELLVEDAVTEAALEVKPNAANEEMQESDSQLELEAQAATEIETVEVDTDVEKALPTDKMQSEATAEEVVETPVVVEPEVVINTPKGKDADVPEGEVEQVSPVDVVGDAGPEVEQASSAEVEVEAKIEDASASQVIEPQVAVINFEGEVGQASPAEVIGDIEPEVEQASSAEVEVEAKIEVEIASQVVESQVAVTSSEGEVEQTSPVEVIGDAGSEVEQTSSAEVKVEAKIEDPSASQVVEPQVAVTSSEGNEVVIPEEGEVQEELSAEVKVEPEIEAAGANQALESQKVEVAVKESAPEDAPHAGREAVSSTESPAKAAHSVETNIETNITATPPDSPVAEPPRRLSVAERIKEVERAEKRAKLAALEDAANAPHVKHVVQSGKVCRKSGVEDSQLDAQEGSTTLEPVVPSEDSETLVCEEVVTDSSVTPAVNEGGHLPESGEMVRDVADIGPTHPEGVGDAVHELVDSSHTAAKVAMGNSLEESQIAETEMGGKPTETVTVEAPAVTVKEPAGTVEVPAVTMEEPAGTVEVPAVTMVEPAGTVEVPAVTMEEPAGAVEAPTVTVEEPAGTVELPAVTMGEHAGTVEEPAVTAEEPAGTLEIPAVTTEEPAETVNVSGEEVREVLAEGVDGLPVEEMMKPLAEEGGEGGLSSGTNGVHTLVRGEASNTVDEAKEVDDAPATTKGGGGVVFEEVVSEEVEKKGLRGEKVKSSNRWAYFGAGTAGVVALIGMAMLKKR
ncbi:unnamed protein product [Choristocarpus tenellus]